MESHFRYHSESELSTPNTGEKGQSKSTNLWDDVYTPEAGYRIVMEEDAFDLQVAVNQLNTDVIAAEGSVEFLGAPIIKKGVAMQAVVIYYY